MRTAAPCLLLAVASLLASGCLHCASDPPTPRDTDLGHCYGYGDRDAGGPMEGCPCTGGATCVAGLVCRCRPGVWFCHPDDYYWSAEPMCDVDASVTDAGQSMDAGAVDGSEQPDSAPS